MSFYHFGDLNCAFCVLNVTGSSTYRNRGKLNETSISVLALSHQLQYPVDEKRVVLLLPLQQTKNALSCQGKENLSGVY